MQTKTIVFATITVLGAGLIAGSVAAPSSVAAQGMAGGKMFEKLDTDSSGTVSLEEARAGLDRKFAHLDADGDGTVSSEEFQAMADRRFAKFDQDGNGEVTREEVSQMKKKWKNKHTN